MIQRLLVATFLLLAACAPNSATHSTDAVIMSTWPGSANAKDFGASLYLIEDMDRFLLDWSKPGDPARFDMTNSVKIGSSVEAIVIFWGCAPDASGKCQLYSEISVLGKAGPLSNPPRPMPVWADVPPPPSGMLQLGQTSTSIAPAGQPAQLRVQALITDRVSGESVTLVVPLNAE